MSSIFLAGAPFLEILSFFLLYFGKDISSETEMVCDLNGSNYLSLIGFIFLKKLQITGIFLVFQFLSNFTYIVLSDL